MFLENGCIVIDEYFFLLRNWLYVESNNSGEEYIDGF